MIEPRTDAGKALVEWATNAYPNQLEIWREHAVLIEREAAAAAPERPPAPDPPLDNVQAFVFAHSAPPATGGLLDGSALTAALDAALHDTPHWLYRFDRLQLAEILARKVAAYAATLAGGEATIKHQVDLIERTLHPRGRCTECGGGEAYWKHGPGDPLAGHHTFQPPAAGSDR